MATPRQLRLLATTNNSRGDLFTRLVGDFFFALGYEELRSNIHKTGRELDIAGHHRLEPTRLLAECKAEAKKIGSADLNKFRGVVVLERGKAAKKNGAKVTGYFVSLGGFTESAVEQEKEADHGTRVILVDGHRVVAELINSRILVPEVEATERAGRCAAQAGLEAPELDGCELLGHSAGYFWAVYYTTSKERTHFVLIHADGTALAAAAAEPLIEADRQIGGRLHQLAYLPPATPAAAQRTSGATALAAYRNFLAAECGSIQLDGLPADADLAALRLKLEKLFVPLRIVEARKERTIGVGEYLALNSRVSILAKPGGGKSTLLKRLAIAYSFPGRRQESSDNLPDLDWLPLFLRCRDLRDRARRPIQEILDSLPSQACMPESDALGFKEEVAGALREGRALLLVDGLDEISEEGARTAFCQNLRTFLAIFPGVAMVVTSREAGYRHVAGVIASTCTQVTLAPFDREDVSRLCESWHVEVVGDSPKVRSEAKQLADKIWENARLRALTENPLMLTTLLVVRRSIGELPTRRVELYQEAVKVLIRTWNTEGFEPMDLSEALAQLSYLAISMMKLGIQRVGHRQLLRLLHEAREVLDTELQFTRLSPEEFVVRIEYRSSLLMQTGHERIDGEMQPLYEFRHLTFQEYLAARALIEEQYPGRAEGRSLLELVEPYIEDERWHEVIPLAALLAGRKAEPLVGHLVELCQKASVDYENDESQRNLKINTRPYNVLSQCLSDEVPLSAGKLRTALTVIAHNAFRPGAGIAELLQSRFKDILFDLVPSLYFNSSRGLDVYSSAFAEVSIQQVHLELGNLRPTEIFKSFLISLLDSNDFLAQAKGAAVCMKMAHSAAFRSENSKQNFFHPLRARLEALIRCESQQVAACAIWALAWLGKNRIPPTLEDSQLLAELLNVWRTAKSVRLRELAAWAFGTQPLLDRSIFCNERWENFDEWFLGTSNKSNRLGLLVLAWYRSGPWTDLELVERFKKYSPTHADKTAWDLLAKLGTPGHELLAKWKNRIEPLFD